MTNFYDVLVAMAGSAIPLLKKRAPVWLLGAVFLLIGVALWKDLVPSPPSGAVDPKPEKKGTAIGPPVITEITPPTGPDRHPRPPRILRKDFDADDKQALVIETLDEPLHFTAHYLPSGMDGSGPRAMLVELRQQPQDARFIVNAGGHRAVSLGKHSYILQLDGEPAERSHWKLTNSR